VGDKKIFEDFQRVDCNDCSHYWDDSCGGVKKDSEKRCTAFLATKRVDIPEQIKALRNDIKWVYMAFFVETILLLLAIGCGLFG
jgi:hypothetical protein